MRQLFLQIYCPKKKDKRRAAEVLLETVVSSGRIALLVKTPLLRRGQECETPKENLTSVSVRGKQALLAIADPESIDNGVSFLLGVQWYGPPCFAVLIGERQLIESKAILSDVSENAPQPLTEVENPHLLCIVEAVDDELLFYGTKSVSEMFVDAFRAEPNASWKE